jgi:opine dehydrogenase
MSVLFMGMADSARRHMAIGKAHLEESSSISSSTPEPSRAINPRVICVIGAGNLGFAQAGHLAALGHEVRLFNRTPQRIDALGTEPRVKLSGVLALEGSLSLATTDLAEAVDGARLVFVDVPASGHTALARSLAPLLADAPGWDPLLVLHPGQTFGSLHFARCLREGGLSDLPRLWELQTAIYTTRASGPGRAKVLAMKKGVATAPFPQDRAGQSPTPPPELAALYPGLHRVASTLITALSNLQAFVHPAVCLFNLTRIERAEPFRVYRDGLTPALEEFLERADAERLALASRLEVAVPSGPEWFASTYGVQGKTIAEAMWKVEAYDALMAPDTLSTRLLWEDVPTGLVPLCSLGETLGVPTPTLSALLGLATSVCGEGLLAQGWSLDRLGLAGASTAQIREAF